MKWIYGRLTPTILSQCGGASRQIITLAALGNPHRCTHRQLSTTSCRWSSAEASSNSFIARHCRLLNEINSSSANLYTKQRRARGVVGKLERDVAEWLEPASDGSQRSRGTFTSLLVTLASIRHLLQDPGASGSSHSLEAGREWTGCSRFCTPEFNDILNVCAESALKESSSHKASLKLLEAIVLLELPGGPLETLCRRVAHSDCLTELSTVECQRALQLISLGVKHCKISAPPLLPLFSRLSSAELDQRGTLSVLSSLVRLKSPQATGLTRLISRRSIGHVESFSTQDVIFALTAAAFLPNVDEVYRCQVIDRCAQLCPSLTASEVGDVCKYVGLLNASRRTINVSTSCELAIKRLLLFLASRCHQLESQFSLRDARYVLRCFKQHDVRHSIVFFKLVSRSNV